MKWLVSVNEYQWYIGYIKQEVENGLLLTIYTELMTQVLSSSYLDSWLCHKLWDLSSMAEREKKKGRQKYKNLNISKTKRAF